MSSTLQALGSVAVGAALLSGCRGSGGTAAAPAMGAASPLLSMTVSVANDEAAPVRPDLVEAVREHAVARGYRLVPVEDAEIVVTCRARETITMLAPESSPKRSQYVQTSLWPRDVTLAGDQRDLAWLADVQVIVAEDDTLPVTGVRVRLGPNEFADPRLDRPSLGVIADGVNDWVTEAVEDANALRAERGPEVARSGATTIEQQPDEPAAQAREMVAAPIAEPEARPPAPTAGHDRDVWPRPALADVVPESLVARVTVVDDRAGLTESTMTGFLQQEAGTRCGFEFRDDAPAALVLSISVTSSTIGATDASAISVLLAVERPVQLGGDPNVRPVALWQQHASGLTPTAQARSKTKVLIETLLDALAADLEGG